MNQQKNILIIVGVVILIVTLLFGFWWWLRFQAQPVTSPVTTISPDLVATSTTVVAPPSAQRLAEERSYPLGLRQLAMSFAERLGSYSSDGDHKNLLDLDSLLTAKMKETSRQIISSDQASSGEVFEGMTTIALSSQLKAVTADRATVVVGTQRTRLAGTNPEQTFYQNLTLEFSKQGDDWLVDQATWN